MVEDAKLSFYIHFFYIKKYNFKSPFKDSVQVAYMGVSPTELNRMYFCINMHRIVL